MTIFQWQKKNNKRVTECRYARPSVLSKLQVYFPSRWSDGEDDQPNVLCREAGRANRRATLRLEAGLDTQTDC